MIKFERPFTKNDCGITNPIMTLDLINFYEEKANQAFEKAKLSKYSKAELDSYEYSLKTYRDLKAVIDSAFDNGKIERTLEIVMSAKEMGLSTNDIIKLTGLSEGEIDKF